MEKTKKKTAAPDRTAEFAAFADASEDHPYLLDQPVGVYGFKQDGKKLLVPICDPFSGQVLGWDEIWDENGQWKKKTTAGTPKKGNGFLIGKIKNNVVPVVEGGKTGASVYEGSGYGCYVAFGSANVVALGKNLRKLYPQHRILFCCDNDEAGRKVAKEAAQAVNGGVCLPEFAVNFGKDTKDFNDLHFQSGAEEVKRQIEADVAACPIPPEPLPEPEPIEFPWPVLPTQLADCLYLLGESCGSSPEPLVGFSLAIVASELGRTVRFSLTNSHREKSLLWFMDIRKSGSGKTPALELLKIPLQERQRTAAREFKTAMKQWSKLDKKQQGDPLTSGFISVREQLLRDYVTYCPKAMAEYLAAMKRARALSRGKTSISPVAEMTGRIG